MRRPPFCPHQGCSCHVDPDSSEAAGLRRRRWFKRNGSYPTKVRGSIPRYKCLACGRGFSAQTFSLDYYTKRIIDYDTVRSELCSNSSVRATARSLGCSCDSVTNRTSRLARQCISASSRMLSAMVLAEDLVGDGFESFAVSQYFPNNIHILVGSHSQLVYFCDYVTLRRSGRMTELQKRTRQALEAGRLVHTRTDSRAARDHRNPLFPVNYIDREFRKDLAEHVRETVRFARNVNHSMERLMVYLLDHNVRKRYRINDPVSLSRTHAGEAGILREHVARATVNLTTARRFLSFEELEPAALRVWRREQSFFLGTRGISFALRRASPRRR